jgi:hypothetical protein
LTHKTTFIFKTQNTLYKEVSIAQLSPNPTIQTGITGKNSREEVKIGAQM